jgi:hypothetical protein
VVVHDEVREHVHAVERAHVDLVEAGQGRKARGAAERERREPLAHRVAEQLAVFLDLAGAVQRHDLHELGVHRRAVQALVVVLDHDLPVRAHVVLATGAHTQLTQAVTSELEQRVGLRGERVVQRPCAGVEVEEHEAVELGDRHGPQTHRVAVDAVCGADVGRAHQAPVERVGPRVVRALDHAARRAGSGQQLGAAVPARVRERAQHPVVTTHHDRRLAGDVGHQVVARLR